MRTPGPIAKKAFPKWVELLGVDPSYFASSDQSAPTETFDESEGDEDDADADQDRITIGDMQDTEQAIAVYDCLALDDGELTAQMMLSRLLDEHIEQEVYSLKDILSSPPVLSRQLQLVREIREILSEDALVLSRAEFSETMRQALSHYGADHNEEVQALVEDDGDLAVLRRDALNALGEMSIAQFLQGDAGPLVRPQYSTTIRRWWNIDHMLAAHASIPEGVSLNLVKTPQEQDMFFCFVVRRGANLYVLNDAPDYEHPLQSQMSRRPDRAFAKRIAKFWFPYEMADVDVSEDGREARLSTRKTRKLVLAGDVDCVSQVIGSIAEMPAQELLWVVMVFDLIMDRFWSPQPLPQMALSYTATQLRPEGQLLLEAAQKANLPVSSSAPGSVVVPDFSVEDVANLHRQPNAGDVLGELGNYGALHWVEQRYKDRVPLESLNHVASEDAPHPRLALDGSFQASPCEDEDRVFGPPTALVSLQALPLVAFGTADQLRANRGFLARHNYAKTLGAFAKQEFKERKQEVQAWLAEAYSKRVEFLKTLAPAAMEGGLQVCDWRPGEGPQSFHFKGGYDVSFQSDSFDFLEKGKGEGCSHRLGWIEDADTKLGSAAFMPYLATGHEAKRNWKPICQETGQKASYFFAFRPTNAVELAWLLGLEVRQLPDVLQHASALYPSAGNCILDRIDPMLWALENPWAKLEMGARMGLSKRGLAQLKKRHPSTVDLSCLDGENLREFQDKPAPTRSSRRSRSP